MSKILSKAEGENASQPSVYTRKVLNKKLAVGTGLILAILIAIAGLNYFNILPISQNLPLLSFLPTSSGASSCKVVEEKFCDTAERITVDINGTKFEYLAFSDLPPGTPVNAPMDGFFASSRESGPESPVAGFSVRMTDNAGIVKGGIVRGNLRLESEIQRDVKAGEIIGYTTGTKTLGEYDLLFTISKSTPNGPVADEDDLRKLFPEAFKKEPVPTKQALKPSVTVSYDSTPPR